MEVVHHGGKASVTGSCHELRADGQALLIDCGLFQGADERPLLWSLRWGMWML